MRILPKRSQKIVETIALDDHVAPHRVFRGSVVTGSDCRDHGIVLGKGTDHPIADL